MVHGARQALLREQVPFEMAASAATRAQQELTVQFHEQNALLAHMDTRPRKILATCTAALLLQLLVVTAHPQTWLLLPPSPLGKQRILIQEKCGPALIPATVSVLQLQMITADLKSESSPKAK
jgi:hypothetical protein